MGNIESGQGGCEQGQVQGDNDSSGLLGIFEQISRDGKEKEEIKEKKMDSGISAILEKKAIKKYQKELEIEAKGNDVQKQPLILDRMPAGLYYVRYERGPVPNAFKGYFTHKKRIYDLAKEYNLTVKE
jgi:hypothetical protein